MVDLLIQLRKPQLSRQLDEKMLAGVLGEALPPPSEQMIDDVAESFRGLESDRLELTRFRSARDGVDGFLRTYKHYAAVASRRRAAEVRQSHNRCESASKDLRQAEREHGEASESLVRVTTTLRSLGITSEELGCQIETLRDDPKMRSAAAIRQAGEDEKQTTEDFEAAQRDVSTASARLEQRKTVQAGARRHAETQLKIARAVCLRSTEVADACDLKAKHEAAFCSLKLQLGIGADPSGDPRSVRREIEEIIEKRVGALERLKKLNVALSSAESDLARAKEGRDNAQRCVEQAIEDERSAENFRRDSVDQFLDSYEMWHRDSDELNMPPGDDMAAGIEEWSKRIEEASPIADAVRTAELAARADVNEEGVRLQHRSESLESERSIAEQLQEKFVQGFQEPPPLPIGVDDAARAAMPGAPFWSLVDYSRTCPHGERANLEGALEASGMLNAWVTPDGSVLTSDFADVLLTIADAPDVAVRQSLAQVLVPDEHGAVAGSAMPDGVILEVLRKIGYGQQNSPTWIAIDGRWRNGPLHGCCRKESVQFIGHDAREEQRIRRLEEVQAELRRIEEEAKQLKQRRRSLDERSLAIDRHIKAVPSDSAIREAAARTAMAAQKLLESRKALTTVEQVVADRRTKADGARNARDLDGRDLGLLAWVDRLEELDRQMTSYQRVLAELWPSIDHFDSLKSQDAAAVAAVSEAEQDITLLREREHTQRTRRAKASQRLKTLQESVGVQAAEILRELEVAVDRRDSLLKEIKQAEIEEKEAGRLVARMDERMASRREIINGETERRRQSCAAFQQLCSLGLLRTAMGESLDEHQSDWSVSRTVDAARQAESALTHVSADDTAWDRVQEAVTTRIQDLNTALSQQAFTSTLQTSDGLYRVTVPYQGRDRSVQELRELLSEEVQQRQLIFDEREREIIENHLIGEVAAKLHEQIHQAHRLVDQMNAEIQKRPMSTGMTLKFDWKPDEELPGGIVEMCKKLLAATGTWSPSERSAIGRYLQDHIKEVRASQEMGTWHEHLAEALDYRRWHRFWVMRKQEATWKRLTKRTHGTGSGGEKAVALTIPQFAAAAAHYSSARDDAPRLILLDEAFAGIDPDMRGKCMELIDVFDLDFLLTSEIEWGCYAGLPGVAIHQLSTRSGFDAVFLTRWIWNGKRRIKDEAELPSPAGPSD